jgi:hypothetical protein
MNFVVKGPLGKGCRIKPHGYHVAFTAGTGILVFLDIVSRLILQNTGNLPDKAERFASSFTFHLFVSFEERNESVGLDLCEALLDLNKELGLNNFKMTLRISNEHSLNDTRDGQRPRRWDDAWIKKQMKEIEKNAAI